MPTMSNCRTGVALLFALVAAALLWAPPVTTQTQPPPLAPRDMAMTMPGTFTLVSVGDLIIRRPASQLDDDDVQAALNEVLEIPVCHVPFTSSDGD